MQPRFPESPCQRHSRSLEVAKDIGDLRILQCLLLVRYDVLRDTRLLAIAGPPFLDEVTLVPGCQAAEGGGATAVQLRWKEASASQLLRFTELLVSTLTIPVYVNDRVDVALAGHARGVHLGAEDLPPTPMREIAPRPFAIGVSVGTMEEAADVLESDVDYWSIGSVYHTQTKPDAGEPIGTDGFRRLAHRAPPDMPVIAIGGIATANVGEILEAGAHGVAVVSAIFGSQDIRRATQNLRAVIDTVLGP